jgi:hypothetical protein
VQARGLRPPRRDLHPGQAGADAIDTQLHRERVAPESRERLFRRAPLDTLPDGAFVLEADEPHLVLGSNLWSWSPAGYAGRRPRPARRDALVITPRSLVEALRSGWKPLVPLVHPSALAT